MQLHIQSASNEEVQQPKSIDKMITKRKHTHNIYSQCFPEKSQFTKSVTFYLNNTKNGFEKIFRYLRKRLIECKVTTYTQMNRFVRITKYFLTRISTT